MKTFFLAAIFLLGGATLASAHNCTNVVQVESQGLLNYLANVSFKAPHNLTGEWVMDMDTDVEFTFLGVSFQKIKNSLA